MNEGGVFMKFDPILFLTIMLIPLTMIGFGFYFLKEDLRQSMVFRIPHEQIHEKSGYLEICP